MRKKLSISDVFKALMVISFIIVFSYMLYGELILPDEVRFGVEKPKEFSQGWTVIRENGDELSVDLPYKMQNLAQGEEHIIMRKTLPDQSIGNKWVFFWNRGNRLNIQVDGESRTSFDTENSRLFGTTSPYVYIFSPLKEADSGKIVTIDLYARNNTLDEIYIGDRFSFVKMLDGLYFVELFLAIILLLLGIAFYIATVVLRFLKQDIGFLRYFSLMVIMSTIWVLTNSGGRQFIFSNVSTARDLAFFAFAALPYPFVMALEIIQKGRYEKAYNVGKCLISISFYTQVLLYATGISDFSYTQFLSVVSIIYGILMIFITIFIDIKNGRRDEYHFMAEAFCGTAVLAGVQMALYATMDGVLTGIVLEVGLLWGLVFTVLSSVKQLLVLNYEKNEALFQSKAKGEFLANMSHEIRTPINAVLGMDEMILREAENEDILGYAQNIKQAGNTLLSLINDILDFSKIESGKMDIIPVNYNAGSMINDLVMLISFRAEKKGLTLRVDVDPEIPAELVGDDVRVKQVITNLLTNAVKYTHSGEVILQAKLVEKDEETCKIKYLVKDTGIGIKEEDKEKLFTSFQRVDEARNRNIEGTGLGLSITLTLLKLMGSNLELESEYGKGSTFFFTLEQKVANQEVIGDFAKNYQKHTKGSTRYKASFYAPTGQILVVDDNAVNLMVMKGLLKLTGLNIDTAESGQAALEKMKKKHYHVIFMDHMMPNMDGIEARRASLEMEGNLCADSKMIILTANAVAGAKEMYLAEGFDDYLAKPVEPKEMERQLIKYLPADVVKMPDENTVSSDLIDKEYGLQLCGNDESLYAMITLAFKEDNHSKSLKKFMSENNLVDYISEIQGMVEALGYIGAKKTATLAGQILESHMENDVADIKEMHEKLVEELDLVAACL